MRRSWRYRLFALLFAPWFAAIAAEAPGIHACPIHSGHAAHARQMVHTAGMAEHGHPTPSPGHHSQECTCLGCCCGSSFVGLPRVLDVAFGATVVSADDRVPTYGTIFVSRAEHFLPFATAPPAIQL